MYRRDDLAGGLMGAALADYTGGRRLPPPRDFGFGFEDDGVRSFSPPPGQYGPRGPPAGYYGRPVPPRDPSPPRWRYGREPSPPRRYGPPRDITPPRYRYRSQPPRDLTPPRGRYGPPEPYRGPMSNRFNSGFNYRDDSPRRRRYRNDPYDSDEDRRRFDEETRLMFSHRGRPERRRPVLNYSGGWY